MTCKFNIILNQKNQNQQMKRSIVLSFVLSTITAATAYAQTTTPSTTPATNNLTSPAMQPVPTPFDKTIHFGLRAGTDLYKLSGKSFDNNFKFGYSGGIYVEWPISRRWGLQPELDINETVARTSPDFNQLYPGIGVSYQNLTLNYISLPILVTFRATDALTILLGPQYGYMYYQTPGVSQQPYGPKDAFTKNDFSVLFGGQLDLSRKIKLGLRYAVQYTQLNHIDDNVDSWKTHGFQAYLTYRLK
jgi:hypothetical protein